MPHSNEQPRTGPGDHVDALLADVANGSRVAFESLYRATSDKLFGICRRVLADRTEAEDVLQEVYVSVWHKAAQFDAKRASAMTWLARITRNRAIDRLRTLPPAISRTPIGAAENMADTAASPAHAAQAATDHERLQACLDELDSRRRMLIRTAYFEGATYEELATRISAPLGSVKSWIRRGLIQLRACLER